MTADDQQTPASSRPTSTNSEAWHEYWRALGQTWRTQPEVDVPRQIYLAEHRAIIADISVGRYPFSAVPLTRADIEWLLATHEDGRGPVDWRDEGQHHRVGIDLRGADLREVDLSALPLAGLLGGLTHDQWQAATREQRLRSVLRLDQANIGQAHLEGSRLKGAVLYAAQLSHAYLDECDLGVADLMWAELEGADLRKADLVGATLTNAHLPAANLEDADLSQAHLQEADMGGARLTGAIFGRAHLQGAYLSSAELAWATFNASRGARVAEVPPRLYRSGAHLEGAVLDMIVAQGVDLRWAHLEGVSMIVAQLEGAKLGGAFLDGANLSGAYMEGADLSRAHLAGANFSDGRSHRARDAAHLEGANLSETDLEGACMRGVHLAGANLRGAHLQRADLREAVLEGKTIPHEDLDFIRIGCPDFSDTLLAAELDEADWDETTAMPSRPRPAARYLGEGSYKLSRTRPKGRQSSE